MSAKLCIQANQDMACPPGPYTVRSVVGTPGDVADTRACGACTCTSDATTCANATFTAYTDAGCSMSATSVAIDGGCHNGGNGQSFSGDTHFVYQATPNLTTCTPSAAKPALSGGFQPNNPITICCQP